MGGEKTTLAKRTKRDADAEKMRREEKGTLVGGEGRREGKREGGAG